MKQRIKDIRKAAGLTQEQFGEKIGVGKMAVTYYEGGKRTPPETTIRLICSVFGVNEEWLRDGIGEPYAEKTDEEEIAQFLGSVLNGMPESESKKKFISALSKMDDSFWIAVEKFEDALLEAQDKNK